MVESPTLTSQSTIDDFSEFETSTVTQEVIQKKLNLDAAFLKLVKPVETHVFLETITQQINTDVSVKRESNKLIH